MSEQGVVRSAEGLADFFENGAIALHLVGGDGTIMRANKAELDLLGYPAEEYIGRHIAEFHADPPVINDILARLLRGETIRRYPARLRARDGSIKHVEITSSGQFLEGNFVNTRCFTVDVTDLVQAREEARRKDDHLRQVLDALPAAIFMIDASGKLTYVNHAARDLAEHEPRIGEDQWHTTFRLFNTDGEEIPIEQRPMTLALSENRPVWGLEALAKRQDGSFVPVIPFPTPIRDENGALTGAVNMFVDMSDRKHAEDMFRLAVEASPSGMVLADAKGRIVLVNGEAEQLFGYGRAELVGQKVEKLIPLRLRTGHAAHRGGYARKPEVRAMGAGRELFGLRKDGTEVPVEIGLSPFRTSRELMILSTIVDISERRRAAEREQLLVRELHHRSNNLFALVQAIIATSLCGDLAIDQARRALQARLQAMARTHRLLGEVNWSGLDLGEVVRAELDPFADRITIDGAGVVVPPDEVQNLSLALHELATNAAKYGALSVPDGRVAIRWSVSTRSGDSLLQFDWQECNGPVVARPSRQGFGSLLINRLFPDVRLDFAPEGVNCRINVPFGMRTRNT